MNETLDFNKDANGEPIVRNEHPYGHCNKVSCEESQMALFLVVDTKGEVPNINYDGIHSCKKKKVQEFKNTDHGYKMRFMQKS